MSDPQQPEEARPPRRPYVRPTVAWEEMMDNRPSLMAACAKIAGQDATCNAAAGGS